jgi:hypothetical protein
VDEPVVEALVVAVMESLLLKFPLKPPVGLGDEDEMGEALVNRFDDLHPVFALQLSAGTASPCLAEDPVDEQDGHVAADSVTLVRDTQKGADGGRPQAGVKDVELGHVFPGRVVGVPATGKDTPA